MNNASDGPGQGQRNRSGGRRRRGRGRKGRDTQQQPQQSPEQPRSSTPRGGGNQGGGGRPRRRGGARRRTPEPTPPTVLRRDAAKQAPVQPMRKRKIAGDDDMSEPEFGCPMLTRTRLGIPFRGGQNLPRCSMGWAVHDEDEVLFCLHTPSRNECWKEHPELLEELVEKLRPVIEAELADEDTLSAD